MIVPPPDLEKPDFYRHPPCREVRSFRQTTWELLRSGHVKVDSANRPQRLQAVSLLHAGALREAGEILRQRHIILRLKVTEDAGRPWLTLHDQAPDFRLFEPDIGYEDDVGAFVWKPFDLTNGPLFRLYGIRQGTAGFIGLVVHHFICDGDSVNLLMRELLAIYRSLLARSRPVETPERVSYVDYLQTLNLWCVTPPVQTARRALTDELSHAAHYVLPATGDVGPQREPVEFDPALTAALRHCAQLAGTTLFTVLLAVQLHMLTAFATGPRQLIKVVVNGRDAPALVNMPGYLADRMFVIQDMSEADRTPEALIRRLHATLIRTRRRAFLRSDIVQSDLAAAGIRNAAPVFNFHPRSPLKPAPNGPASVSVPPFRAVPPPETTGADALCAPYWLELKDHGNLLTGHFRYANAADMPLKTLFVETCRYFAGQMTSSGADVPTFTEA